MRRTVTKQFVSPAFALALASTCLAACRTTDTLAVVSQSFENERYKTVVKSEIDLCALREQRNFVPYHLRETTCEHATNACFEELARAVPSSFVLQCEPNGRLVFSTAAFGVNAMRASQADNETCIRVCAASMLGSRYESNPIKATQFFYRLK